MSYTDAQVADIIEKYIGMVMSRSYLLNLGIDANFSDRISAADNLERTVMRLRDVTSMELREILPINLNVLEELCKQTRNI